MASDGRLRRLDEGSLPLYAKQVRRRCMSADLAAAEAYKLTKQIRSIIGKRLDILAANAGIPKSTVVDAASLAT
jgi:hypothetical protein